MNYRLNDKFGVSDKKVDTSELKVDTSVLVPEYQEGDSTKVDTSGSKVDTLSTKVDTLSTKVDTSETKKRLSRNELELLIMRACKDKYLKMDEVARRINKSTDYLKNKIFPSMIKEGKLIKHFPFTHNHPEQGYKTSEEYANKL